MAELGLEAPENRVVEELPFRLGWSHVAESSDDRIASWEVRRAARNQMDVNTDETSKN
jgi:hypothetical protein